MTARIETREYIRKAGDVGTVLNKAWTKNYETNEEALEQFTFFKHGYTVICGDSDVQADGSGFQANLGDGKIIFMELWTD